MLVGINQKIAPIRFGILIKPKSKSRFERALELACSLWGGIFTPIIPLYKNMPKSYRIEYQIGISTIDFYKNTLNNFDPDIILFDEELDEDYIKKIVGDRETQKISNFIENFNSNYVRHGLEIDKVLTSIIKSEFKFQRNDDLKIIIPTISKGDLLLKSFLCSWTKDYKSKVLTSLKEEPFFESPKVDYENINNVLTNNNISILELNLYKLQSYAKRHWLRGIAIYFLNDNNLNDINNFWNLRALGWFIIPVPASQIENPYFHGLIERFTKIYNDSSENSWFLTCLISNSVKKNEFQLFSNQLEKTAAKLLKNEKQYSFQSWFPRFWSDKSILEADKVICCNQYVDTNYEQIESKENYLKFYARELPFDIEYSYTSEANYKICLSISYFDEYAKKAGIIHGIDTIDWIRLTHSFDRTKWRISKSGLNYFVGDKKDRISFNIPDSLPFFKKYFAKNLHTLKETPNGKLADEVLKNIGGINGTYLLSNASLLKIIELFEDGKVVNFKHLLAEIKRNIGNKNAENVIARLLENKIIELGATLQCKVCNQRTFYLPNEINLEITCSICRNKYNLPSHKPSEIEWSYRGIGPFSKNNKVGGIISVFLCLKLLKDEFGERSGSISALIGFELIKKGENPKEVDLGALIKEKYDDEQPPNLFLCECKTYKRFTKKDFERMKELGNEFPNSILTFSTLNDSLEDSEKREFKKLVKYFRKGVGNRPRNPILILTANELMPTSYLDSFSEYKDKSKPYQRYNDWLGHLCEKTVEKHLNLETWGAIQSKKWQQAMTIRKKENDK